MDRDKLLEEAKLLKSFSKNGQAIIAISRIEQELKRLWKQEDLNKTTIDVLLRKIESIEEPKTVNTTTLMF